MKSVHIRSFSGPHFPEFRLNTDGYGVSLHIQFKWGKIRTGKTPNTDTFHALKSMHIDSVNLQNIFNCSSYKVYIKKLIDQFTKNLDVIWQISIAFINWNVTLYIEALDFKLRHWILNWKIVFQVERPCFTLNLAFSVRTLFSNWRIEFKLVIFWILRIQ